MGASKENKKEIKEKTTKELKEENKVKQTENKKIEETSDIEKQIRKGNIIIKMLNVLLFALFVFFVVNAISEKKNMEKSTQLAEIDKKEYTNFEVIQNKDDFDKAIKNENVCILITMETCPPCKIQKEIYDEIVKDNDKKDLIEKYKFYVLDLQNSENKFIKKDYDVKYTPTTLILTNGEKKEKLEGVYKKEEIIESLNKYIKTSEEKVEEKTQENSNK